MILQLLTLSFKYEKELFAIDLFTTRHKVVHNGGSPNLKGSLLDKKTT